MKEKKGWEREVLRNAPPDWDQELDVEGDDGMAWSQQGSQAFGMPSSAFDNRARMSSQPKNTPISGIDGAEYGDLEVDEALLQEEAELEALVGMMTNEEEQTYVNEHQEEMSHNSVLDDRSSVFGSDDEAYEDLFMDFVDQQPSGRPGAVEAQGEEMDLTS